MRTLTNANFFGEFYQKFQKQFPGVTHNLLKIEQQTAPGLVSEFTVLRSAHYSLYVVCVPLSCYFLPQTAGIYGPKLEHAVAVSHAILELEEELRQKDSAGKFVYVYEDVYRKNPEAAFQRLGMMLGQGGRIFARNCRAERIDPNLGREFLRLHHAYGNAGARYYYGLFLRRQGREMDGSMKQNMPRDMLVAVASFSAARKMKYEDGRTSSEWVRYAALSGLRIVGGMSMLLKFYLKEQQPDEVMTYADLEWSQGDAYRKMGFEEVSEREPVSFLVDSNTFERTHLSKVEPDSLSAASLIVANLGSLKMVLRNKKAADR